LTETYPKRSSFIGLKVTLNNDVTKVKVEYTANLILDYDVIPLY
jgi:hypothetical protein